MEKHQVRTAAWLSTLGWTFGSMLGWLGGWWTGVLIGDRFPALISAPNPSHPPDLVRAIASQETGLVFGLIGLMLGWAVSALVMSILVKQLWQKSFPAAGWKHALLLFAGWTLPACLLCTACSILNIR